MPNYPEATRPRRAYDADGSTVWVVDGSVATAADPADVTELNQSSEGGGVAVGTNEWLAIVFPARITIDAMFVAHGGTSDTTLDIETSLDSTDGEDGTWTPQGSVAVKRGDTVTDDDTWRANLVTGLSLTCRAIRIEPGTTRWQNWHLHGSGSQEVSGLRILSDEYSAFPSGTFDWGRCARGSSEDTQVVVQNPTTRDALGVVLTIEAGETSDEFADQHYLSIDGGRNFAATVNLGVIGAGARSTVVHVRRVTPAAATVGARSARLVASAAGWD